MSEYTIHIEPTKNPDIIKFETKQFLTRHENFEFGNIEEAANSPIAQQLFHLPFVKTIFIAQNFIAIQKYNIVPWEDVQEEVAEQIKDYLNGGGQVIKVKNEPQAGKVPVTIYAEITPNPAVIKFVANKKLVISTAEFKNIDEAKDSPLATQLFNFPFVKEVFMDENYISINKYEVADWNEITMELREFIKTYLEDDKEIITSESPAVKKEEPAAVEPKNLDEISTQVIEILNEYVKPAVASDGGNIIFDSYKPDTKTVKVILQGACSGCPSSTATLKNGIESMLREMMSGKVEYVEAVNG